MSIHQDAVKNNELFKEFDKLAGFEHVSTAEIDLLKGTVLEVAAQIGPHLDRIQNTFQQYTSHDIQHLLNVTSHICSFLPKVIERDKAVSLNAVELAYLWLAIIDDALFAEFIRRRHASRVHKYIRKYLANRLRFREIDLSAEVGNLCESHNWASGRPASQASPPLTN